jgi:hypothetical protein
MNYGTSRISATSWTSTRACYSQRRLMLWSETATQSVDAGRRFMPPCEPSAGTQPGRERPHSPRPVGRPSAGPGVAHVPAASIGSTADSARHRLVPCTCDVRPTFTAPTAAQITRDRARHYERISA